MRLLFTSTRSTLRLVAVMPRLASCEGLLEIVASKLECLGAESTATLVIVIGGLQEMTKTRRRKTCSSLDENVKLVLSVML